MSKEQQTLLAPDVTACEPEKPVFPFDVIVKEQKKTRDSWIQKKENNNSDYDSDENLSLNDSAGPRETSNLMPNAKVPTASISECQDHIADIQGFDPEILLDPIHGNTIDTANNFVGQTEDLVNEFEENAERIILNSVLADPDMMAVQEEGCEAEEEFVFCFPTLDAAREQANIFARRVWSASWKATHFYSLPEWLQDNDFLHSGHRPPLPSVAACFNSIFRVHTETGNIWTHMIGCVAFIGMAAYFLTRPHHEVQWLDKVVILPFFVGAVACLGLSFTFHTLHCHSERMGKLFSKLDYVGISLLIMGSFVPWLYYGFYCRPLPQIAYISSIVVLGILCIVVSLWDKFSQPRFRPLRAGLFMGLGLSGVIPCGHYFVANGFWSAVYQASMGWLVLMAVLYIAGALFYALRIPERFFPGKCDIWFQSHQIFHLLVVAAAFVHYHGVTEMAVQRLSGGSCDEVLDQQLFDKLLQAQQDGRLVEPENFRLEL